MPSAYAEGAVGCAAVIVRFLVLEYKGGVARYKGDAGDECTKRFDDGVLKDAALAGDDPGFGHHKGLCEAEWEDMFAFWLTKGKHSSKCSFSAEILDYQTEKLVQHEGLCGKVAVGCGGCAVGRTS